LSAFANLRQCGWNHTRSRRRASLRASSFTYDKSPLHSLDSRPASGDNESRGLCFNRYCSYMALFERNCPIGPIGHSDWDGPQRRQLFVQWTIRFVRVREPHRCGRDGRFWIIVAQFTSSFHRQEKHHVA